jgi:putative membrane protein
MKFRVLGAGLCGLALFVFPAMSQANKLSKADQQFLTMAAETNMTEAHIGQMAESQANSQAAKDFGKQLDQDHTAAYTELLQLAQKEGDDIPRGINTRRNSAITSLASMKGKAFDRAFARDEAMDHQRALAAFQREANHGTDPDVKAYAAKQISTMKSHLDMAKGLEK